MRCPHDIASPLPEWHGDKKQRFFLAEGVLGRAALLEAIDSTVHDYPF